MDRRNIYSLFLIFTFVFLQFPSSAYSLQSDANRYAQLLELGKKALYEGDYDVAGQYFTHAKFIRPDAKDPTEYLAFIKRVKAGPQQSYAADPVIVSSPSSNKITTPTQIQKQIQEPTSLPDKTVQALGNNVTPPSKAPIPYQQEVIDLDDALWNTQPRTLIQVQLRSSLILRGNNIQRFLILDPGFIEIKQLNKDEVNIVALKRGSTLIHLWDDRGRWTFNIQVILPLQSSTVAPSTQDTRYTNVEPFRVSYYSDWSTYNVGRTLTDTDRKSLNYVQTVKIEGETPYGFADSWVVFNKFAQSTEATGYGFGISDGHIGKWKNFNIRAFDTAKTFSPLTMPGQYLRGIIYEQRLFKDNVDFAYVHGRDRATYGFLAPGILDTRESFVEGAKVTLFGNTENNYSLNYARGWGNARPAFLDEQVYSVEVNRRTGPVYWENELAFDDADFAKTVKVSDQTKNFDWALSLRDIDKEFTTITNLPPNQGEVGGTLSANWQLANNITFDSVLDIYRDRLFYNPEDPRAANYDFTSYMDIPLGPHDRLNSSVLYTNTPGELSPRNNIRLNTNYTKRFEWFANHPFTTLIGGTLQRSRYKFSPTSDFDRQSLLAGFRTPVIKNLDYFLNYEWSWVQNKESNVDFTPSVLNTGVNYSYQLTKTWSGDANVTYRNEEQADGLNSFLAGEDSIAFGLGLNYRPATDWEFFTDGRLRNVWRESDESVAFNEFDVHWGVRSQWVTPIFWNPTGTIYGTVYKDTNDNAQRDLGEEGVAGVTVHVGKEEATTNEKGYYIAKVRAKTVMVGVDINSLPRGFILKGEPKKEAVISAHQRRGVDFAVNTQSGIYGIVYEDLNGNHQPDANDKYIERVRVTLDNQEVTMSEFDGSYYFRNVPAGKHTLTFDVNSFPKNYLPAIKIRHTVNIDEGSTYTLHIPVVKKEK